MLGLFYAYTEKYKHNDSFLKTKQTFALCSKYNFIKLQNVCDPYIYRYVCGEMTVFFFEFFINHFQEIHRSVLRNIAINLFMFENFMTSISAEIQIIPAEESSLYNFFKEKKRLQHGCFPVEFVKL